jgi:DNA-binding transcriptional ArsR family regulator
MTASIPIDTIQLKKAALFYHAVNNKVRQQILRLHHKNARMTVTPIYKAIKLEQSATSQHLTSLRRACLVHTERDGKFIFYSINYQRLKHLHDVAETLQFIAPATMKKSAR